MSAPEFDIIFRGDLVLGHQLSEVKLRLQQLFKADAAKVDALFSGRPVPLKRNLDQATANKYREVLLKAGAQVELCVSGGAALAPQAVAKAMVKPSAEPQGGLEAKPSVELKPAEPLQAKAAPQQPSWSLAPAGSDLLSPEQRRSAPPPALDLTSFSLREQTGNLLDSSELAPPAKASVAVPNLDLAEPGARLTDEDHLPLPMVDIELDDWQLAEVGADLLLADERAVQVPVALGPLDFSLAPPGSDLGQLKSTLKPLNPDTSALHLVADK